MTQRTEPGRSCIGCRAVKEKGMLLRFVLGPEQEVVPDLLARLPGRGAYACLNPECIRTAVARKQFARTFKREVRVAEADVLLAQIRERLEGKIAGTLALANKAGKVVSGGEMVLAALRARKAPGILVLAQDISPEIGVRLTGIAERQQWEVFHLFGKEKLGALLGKGSRSALAILAPGFCTAVKKDMETFRQMFEGGETR